MTGPPDHTRRKKTERQNDGSISIRNNRLLDLEDQIQWQSLTPFQEYIILILDDMGAFDE